MFPLSWWRFKDEDGGRQPPEGVNDSLTTLSAALIMLAALTRAREAGADSNAL